MTNDTLAGKIEECINSISSYIINEAVRQAEKATEGLNIKIGKVTRKETKNRSETKPVRIGKPKHSEAVKKIYEGLKKKQVVPGAAEALKLQDEHWHAEPMPVNTFAEENYIDAKKKKMGRPKEKFPDTEPDAVKMRLSGCTWQQIGERFGVAAQTAINRYGGAAAKAVIEKKEAEDAKKND